MLWATALIMGSQFSAKWVGREPTGSTGRVWANARCDLNIEGPRCVLSDFPFWEMIRLPFTLPQPNSRVRGMQKSVHSRVYKKLLTALKAAREAAGLSQLQVAAKLKTYASFVSKVESGERRLDVIELAELCDVYGCDMIRMLRDVGAIS